MSHPDHPARPIGKPRLALAPKPPRAPAPLGRLPAPGSLDRLWRMARLRASRSRSASWAMGAGMIGAGVAGASILWSASTFLGSAGGRAIDAWSMGFLGLDAGLAELAGSHPATACPLLGLGLLMALMLALRWAAWLAIDVPMGIGALGARKPHPGDLPASMATILPLASRGSVALHGVCGLILATCMAWSGGASYEKFEDRISERLRAALAHQQPEAAPSAPAAPTAPSTPNRPAP